MSDASLPKCPDCDRVEYDCMCVDAINEIICKHCEHQGSPILVRMPLPSGGEHLKVSCRACRSYIKFANAEEKKFLAGEYNEKL